MCRIACPVSTPGQSKPPPAPSEQPSQDVLRVTVSTLPSGHIADIWTAVGGLTGQAEGEWLGGMKVVRK